MHAPTWQRTLPALLAAWLFAGTAMAAQRIQAQFEARSGPRITGTSTLAGFENSIDLTSFQWGVSVPVSRPTGGGASIGKPSMSEITWSQLQDTSVNRLNAALFSSGRYDATFSFVDASRPGPAASYLTMRTGQSAISAVSVSSGGERPTVSASERFASFDLSYEPARLGKPGPGARVSYDTTRGTVSGQATRSPVGPVGGGGGGRAGGLYLRLGAPGAVIAGDSTDRGYENWIKVDAFSMGWAIDFGSGSGGGGGGGVAKPVVSALTVSHGLDGAVPAILYNLLGGRSVGQATLEFVESTAKGSVTTMQLQLDNPVFSALSISSGGGDRPSFAESIEFTGFTQTLWDLAPDGSRGAADVFSFDVLRNVVRRDATTALVIGGFGAGQLGAAAAPVPEPQTWALMAAGLAALAALRRRRAG